MKTSAYRFSQKVLGEAGVRLITTIFILLLARSIGASSFGLYSTAMAYAAFCIVFVDLGTNSILVREIARHPSNRVHIAESSHLLKIIAALISWLLLFGLTVLLHMPAEQRYVTLCLGIVMIGYTLTEYFSALLNGIEEMGWEATLKVLSRTLSLIPGFVALAMHRSLTTIVLDMAIGTAIGYTLSVWIVHARFSSFGIVLDLPYLKTLAGWCLPLFGSIIFWVLYDNQDILLLNYFHFAARDIGLFSAAMKIIDVARVYPVLVLGVFFPTLSKLHLADPSGFVLKCQRLFIFMFVTLSIGAATLYIAAQRIIQVLYKNDFLQASRYLALLAPIIVLIGLNHTLVQYSIVLNRERRLFVGAVLVCLVNLLLACLFLPRFGVSGTCYALLGSELTYFLFLRRIVRSET